ncbi:MAG: DNA-binding protein [Clostridia bacterium]|nr:DNA-binding protein [Clostridia bacterium]
MEENIEFTILLDTYEKLLTETQAKILRMRFDEDLSLGEIGEICSVSRQAARDAIIKGEQKLMFYENALKIVSKERKILQIAQELEQNENCSEYGKMLKNVMEEQ